MSSGRDGSKNIFLTYRSDKWNKECRNFKKDDVVLVMDETMPRDTWLLGRIMEVKRKEMALFVRFW